MNFRTYSQDLAFYVVAKAVQAFSWLFVVWFLTHSMATEEYGSYALLYSFITIGAIASTTWLATSIQRFLPEFVERQEEPLFRWISFRLGFWTVITGAIAMIALYTVAVRWGVFDTRVHTLLTVAGAFISLSAFNLYTLYLSSLRAVLRYACAVIGQMSLFVLGLLWLVPSAEDKTLAVFAVFAFATTTVCVAGLLLSRRRNEDEPVVHAQKPLSTYGREYFKYGMPLLVMLVSIQISMYGDQVVIWSYLGREAVGIYAPNYLFTERLIVTTYSVMTIAYVPILYRHWEAGHRDKAYRFLWQAVALYLLLVTPVVLILYFKGQWLASFVIDDAYREGAVVIPVLALSIWLASTANMFADTLTLRKKTAVMAGIYTSGALINILLNIALVPIYGILGAAYATAITYVLLALVMIIAVKTNSDIFAHYRFWR